MCARDRIRMTSDGSGYAVPGGGDWDIPPPSIDRRGGVDRIRMSDGSGCCGGAAWPPPSISRCPWALARQPID
jgi:hypothetical protein